jgi:hypothetical protein
LARCLLLAQSGHRNQKLQLPECNVMKDFNVWMFQAILLPPKICAAVIGCGQRAGIWAGKTA